MQIKFHTRKLISFSPASIESLKELTLVGVSQMRSAILNNNKNNIAITAKIDNELIAWCLIQKRYSRPNRAHAIVQVFVKHNYRRNGIGSKLITRAINYIKRYKFYEITCSPWNFESKKFFQATGFISENKSRIWSKHVKKTKKSYFVSCK